MKKYIYGIIFICLMASGVLLSSCSKKDEGEKDVPAYTIVENGSMGTDIGLDGMWEEVINKEYVEIQNEYRLIDDIKYSLEDYYYCSDNCIVGYSIKITKSDSTNISDEQYKELRYMFDEGYMEVGVENVSFTYVNNEMTKKGDAVYLSGLILLSECLQTEQSDAGLKKLYLDVDGKNVDFQLPDFNEPYERVEFNTDGSDKLKSCKINDVSISIVWNLNNVIGEFDKELEQKENELGESFNEEDYGYDVYKDITLLYNDGTKKDIVKDGNIVIDSTDAFGEDRTAEKRSNLQILFADEIDADNISQIMIDGETFDRK
ncbi:MAG: hypothetical protein ACI4EF_01335 [Coprococcus sp.]